MVTIETDPTATGTEMYDHALSICTLTNSKTADLFTVPGIEGTNYIMGL